MSKSDKIRLRWWIAAIFVLGALGAGGWYLAGRMEKAQPLFEQLQIPAYFGESTTISGRIEDVGSGLDSFSVSIVIQGVGEHILAQSEFAPSSFFAKSTENAAQFFATVEPKKLGLADGQALIRLTANDASWRNWGKGSSASLEIPVTIDTRPPSISVLTRQHNLNQGGAGLIIYRVNKPLKKDGVLVGDIFYPGHAASPQDPLTRLAFFALTHEQGQGTQMAIEAVDMAGNRSRTGFYSHINNRRFPHDTLNISDSFLSLILPRFEPLPGADPQSTPKEKFLIVNRLLRQANEDLFRKTAKKTEPEMLWSGIFGRLPNAANRAGFGDRRSYRYDGQIIDEQVHLGIDLASLALSPVPASNAGRVALAQDVGIYGLTVMLDHGFGLFTHYSHLSNMAVEVGQFVEKGQVVGNTGTTGLAVGDHLHYGVMVGPTFVNPLEWWDENWIKNNVSDKIAQALNPEQNQ
ncbi:MAG: M23 family metallopeptidase [Desulfatibacillaceae bacterium]|nr:M23 family metallopeptidase [Desulfatibacillaceae bacterium]